MSEIEYVLNKKKLPQWIANVRQEIANIQSGEARWRTGPPLHFEVGKAVPVFITLDRFQASPTRKNYDSFIEIASQDLGAPTGTGFSTWGGGMWSTIKDGKPTPTPVKAFEVKLFDGLYDCFRVARIQLEPKQIEAFEKATLRLAKTFNEEITGEIRKQLDDVVTKLKAQDAKIVKLKTIEAAVAVGSFNQTPDAKVPETTTSEAPAVTRTVTPIAKADELHDLADTAADLGRFTPIKDQ